MIVVFTSEGKTWDSQIDPRLGRAKFFLVFDEDKNRTEVVDNNDVIAMAHGAGPKAIQKLFQYDPDIIITGNGPGGNAAEVLKKTNIGVYIGAEGKTIKEAWEAFSNNALEKF